MAWTYDKLLEVKDLNTSFKIDAGKVLAVNGVSFSVNPGKILGIVGESGSGKSVTAYSIMGILDKNGKVDSGKIVYNGTDLLKISEKEYRNIRGNRISIIFQDAMTSLNPTWSIGNQLREAILTHAKNPVEQAVYDISNTIKSDEQRIVSLKAAIIRHPDRQELKDDLVKVEQKLIDDRETYKVKKQEATEAYLKLKKEQDDLYKSNLPKLNKDIKDALRVHLKNYFKLNAYPKKEEVLALDESKRLSQLIRNKSQEIKDQKEKIAKIKQDHKENKDKHKDSDYMSIYLHDYKGEKRVLASMKYDLRIAKLDYSKFVNLYVLKVRFAPRRQRRRDYLAKVRAKHDFRAECISKYKETKYSANKKALAMLNEVGITEPEKRMKQYPFELSGGMLQRCMIAMALVERPDILIADEPTTALDVTIQAQILELLKKLQKEYGMAVIIITHDLGVVAQICDEVDIMYAGRIVERGTVDEIFYNPQHEYTKGLINSIPKIDSKGKKLEPIQGNPVDLFCLPKGCAFSSRCKECMQICIDQYPEEVRCGETGHAASCWKLIKTLHEQGKIDLVNGTPEGKPLNYNGAVIASEKKRKGKK